MKQPTYTELVEILKRLPPTWYPALLEVMIVAAYYQMVFVPGGASRYVADVERKIHPVQPEGF